MLPRAGTLTRLGGVPERSNGAVSKTVKGASSSRVQIPPPPLMRPRSRNDAMTHPAGRAIVAHQLAADPTRRRGRAEHLALDAWALGARRRDASDQREVWAIVSRIDLPGCASSSGTICRSRPARAAQCSPGTGVRVVLRPSAALAEAGARERPATSISSISSRRLALRYPSPATGLGAPVVVGPLAGSLETPPGFEGETSGEPWYVKLRRLDRFRIRHDPLLRRTV